MHDSIQLGIIVAMEVELDGIRSAMKDSKHQRIGTMDFHTGVIAGVSVVAARCGIGKVCAAMCAQTMILQFHPAYMLGAGIAGSLRYLSVGGVAIGDALLQHDFDICAWNYPLAYIPELKTVRMESDAPMVTALVNAAEKLGFAFACGTIISGDSFISQADKKKQLLDNFQDAIACEMEGAAIAQVCTMNQLPFCVVRAISDSSDGIETEYSWTMEELASQVSARMVLTFIEGEFFHGEVVD